ncbi:MAG: DUF3127 domain-containing protein [Bacteroidaceae bacterium]|nr:DUF3127 domain-containing protein [Bacteroidaceae bacterium]
MDITGRIIAVLPERSGVSQRSGAEWKAGSYVLETQEQYPKKICFDVFGADRLQQFNIQVGEMMTVSFDIDAHEYNGRWFNSIRAFRVDRNIQAAPAPGAPAEAPMGGAAPMPSAAPFAAAPAATPSAPAPDTAPFGGEPAGDSDLPF